MRMSEQEDKGLVPVLRFPEFRVVGAWTKYQLGQCLSRHPNYGINAPAVPYSDNLPRYLRITDISDDGEIRQDQKASVAKGVADENYLDEGDVVLARTGASVGKAYKYRLKDGKLVFAGFLIRVKPDARKLNSELFFQFLFTEQYWHWVNLTSARSGQPGINGNEYSLLPIPLPPTLNEQHKIADCLTSIDELITAQTQKLDALKTHKKGLMQQLFPAEGETTPKLRFPEFRGKGEWEEVPLGAIAEIKLGKMLDKQKHTTGRLLPYLNNLSVRWNEVNTSDLPQMYFDDDELDRFGLRVGDVVVCEGGEPGRAAVWDGRIPNLKFQKAIHRVRFNVPFEPKLMVLHLENLAGTTQFEMLFTGGGIKHLTREAFAQLKIPLIPQAEQQKITNCLSSVDDLITAQTQKLNTLKVHKKGLMQKLFPNVNEVC